MIKVNGKYVCTLSVSSLPNYNILCILPQSKPCTEFTLESPFLVPTKDEVQAFQCCLWPFGVWLQASISNFASCFSLSDTLPPAVGTPLEVQELCDMFSFLHGFGTSHRHLCQDCPLLPVQMLSLCDAVPTTPFPATHADLAVSPSVRWHLSCCSGIFTYISVFAFKWWTLQGLDKEKSFLGKMEKERVTSSTPA